MSDNLIIKYNHDHLEDGSNVCRDKNTYTKEDWVELLEKAEAIGGSITLKELKPTDQIEETSGPSDYPHQTTAKVQYIAALPMDSLKIETGEGLSAKTLEWSTQDGHVIGDGTFGYTSWDDTKGRLGYILLNGGSEAFPLTVHLHKGEKRVGTITAPPYGSWKGTTTGYIQFH